MEEETLRKKINETGGKCEGLFIALFAARKTVGDDILTQFMDRVEEKNSHLWDRYEQYQQKNPAKSEFHHFILSVVNPPIPEHAQ